MNASFTEGFDIVDSIFKAGNTIGLHLQTQNLEPSCTALSTVPQKSIAQ